VIAVLTSRNNKVRISTAFNSILTAFCPPGSSRRHPGDVGVSSPGGRRCEVRGRLHGVSHRSQDGVVMQVISNANSRNFHADSCHFNPILTLIYTI